MRIDKRTVIYSIIALATAAMAFVVTPMQVKNIIALNKNILKLREDIDKVHEDVASKKETSADIEKIKSAIAARQNKIIGYQDISSLQAYISAKAKINGLELAETAALPPTKYKKIGETSLVHIPLNISLRGNFHSLGRFINDLETGEYSLSVADLNVSGYGQQQTISLGIVALAKE